MHSDGATSGSFTTNGMASDLNTYFADGIVPLIEFSRIVNWEDTQQSWWDNFFSYWGNWMQTNHPNKFFLFSPACEFNYPDDISSTLRYNVDGTASNPKTISRKIFANDYVPVMQMIRKARDGAGLQNIIKIVVHCNIGWWASDTLSEMLTNWDGFTDYYDGFAQADVFGFSHYYGYLDPVNNPSGASWQTTLEYSWQRCKSAWEEVCKRAGKTLPFLFCEYSVGNVWKEDKDPIWKEAVEYSYTQMLQNNPWVKGFNWYCSKFIEPDAMDELKRLAKRYD